MQLKISWVCGRASGGVEPQCLSGRLHLSPREIAFMFQFVVSQSNFGPK